MLGAFEPAMLFEWMNFLLSSEKLCCALFFRSDSRLSLLMSLPVC